MKWCQVLHGKWFSLIPLKQIISGIKLGSPANVQSRQNDIAREEKKKDGIKVDKKEEAKCLLKVQRYLRSHSLRVIGNLQH